MIEHMACQGSRALIPELRPLREALQSLKRAGEGACSPANGQVEEAQGIQRGVEEDMIRFEGYPLQGQAVSLTGSGEA